MPLSPGTRLGAYEIVGRLGAGGMGEVYRARDPRLGREVAVKVLPADVASSPERLARFEREARTVAGLNHPNIVTIHSIEDADGIRFLAMELVEGKTLRELITEGPLPLRELLQIGSQAAEGLARAHSGGILHRDLKPDNLMITDTGGPVGVAGVMGGEETEVDERTTNVLIEAANFNMISIRKTTQQMKLPSEAASRFGRGIHPAMALRGNIRSATFIRQWAGGTIDAGVVDNYPVPAPIVTIDLTVDEVKRILGFDIDFDDIVRILESLEFKTEISDRRSAIRVTVPDHRTDCDGPHDLIEEIARIYGYDRIPFTAMDDEMPPQRSQPDLEHEERVRDLLVEVGLYEAATYSMVTPQREALLLPDHRPDDRPYVEIANPISTERTHMRHTLLPNLLDVTAQNLRHHERVVLFEINKVYLASEDGPLPDEPRRLAIVMTGPREPESWKGGDRTLLDFYDLKGVVETLLAGLRIAGVR